MSAGGKPPVVGVRHPPKSLGVFKGTGMAPPIDRVQTALRHESKRRPLARGQVRARLPASFRGGHR